MSAQGMGLSGDGAPLLRAGDMATADLSAGQLINARVVEDMGEGRYKLNLGGRAVTVESRVPLSPQQQLQARVVQVEGQVVLEVLPEVSSSAASSTASREGDQAATAAPFRLAVPVESLGKMADAAAAAARSDTPVLITTNDSGQATVRLPGGAEVAVTLREASVASETPGVTPPPLPPEVLAALPREVQALLRQVTLPVTALPPESAPVEPGATPVTAPADPVAGATVVPGHVRVTAVELPVLVDALEQLQSLASPQSGTAMLLDAVVLQPPDADGRALLRAGALRILAQIPNSVTFAEGQAIPIRIGSEALVSARLLVDGQALSPDAGAGEAGNVSESPVNALLRSAGLTPSPLAREAAEALLSQSVPVTQGNLQALLAVAGETGGAERAALLDAAARLLAHGLPPARSLAEGLVNAESGPPLATALDMLGAQLRSAANSLPIEAQPALDTALQALDRLPVPLETEGKAAALQQFMQTHGKEQLGTILQTLEQATRQALAQHQGLQRVGAGIDALLGLATRATLAQPTADTGAPSALPGLGASDPILRPPATGEFDPSVISRWVRAIAEAESPVQAADAARRMLQESPQFARAVLDELEAMERETLARDPALNRLGEASETLRDIGRRFLAHRAETAAGQRQDPSQFTAEVPFRWEGQDGSGKLQVYYRRQRRGANRRWNARVVLDLHTSRLGPVLGDLQFHNKDLQLRLFTQTQDAAEYLATEAETLQEALAEKGFHAMPEFHRIPDEPEDMTLPVPRPHPERPPRPHDGRLDVEV